MRKKVSGFLLIVFFGFVIITAIKGYLYNKELETHKAFTICKYIRCKYYPKTSEACFKYYVNNKLYKNSDGRCPDNSDKKLQKFFVIAYSTRDPNKINVDFSKEVKDTTTILNAGFTLVEGKIR